MLVTGWQISRKGTTVYFVFQVIIISQSIPYGDMQENPLYKGDKETFRIFDSNGDAAIEKTTLLFDQLKKSGFSAEQ